MNSTEKTNHRLIILSICMAGIFLLDLALPLGVAGGVPYVVIVLASLWSPGKRLTLIVATVGSVLTILGYFFSPHGGVTWVVLINRFFALFAIWVTAILSLHRKRSEKALLEESEEKTGAILNVAADGIISIDERGNMQAFNKTAEEIFGYRAVEVTGKNVSMLIPSSYAEEHDGYLYNCLNNGKREAIGIGREVKGRRKNGAIFPMYISVSEMRLGKKRMFTGMVRDITSRKKTEEDLRCQAQIIDHVKGSIVLTDLGGYITRWNNGAEKLFGYTAQEMLKKHITLVYPGEKHEFLQDVAALLNEKENHEIEVRMQRKSGGEFFAHISLSILRDEEEIATGIIMYSMDITARKKAEKDIESIARFPNESPQPVIRVSTDGTIIYANKASSQISPEEYKVGRLIPERLRKHAMEAFQSGMNKTIEIERAGKFYSIIILPVINEGYINLYGNDITEHKLAEEELARLGMAVEQSVDGIFITDINGNIQYANPSFERITGFSREDAIGKNLSLLKNGNGDNAFYAAMWNTLKEGGVWQGNLTNVKKDGSKYEEYLSITPVLDSSGKVVNYVASMRDITNELKMEKHLSQKQKMEAVGTLAGGIAHDFNNILQSIIGFAQLAIFHPKDSKKSNEYMKNILVAGERARKLVEQILAFSRRGEAARKPLRIHLILKESIGLIRATLPSNIEIRENISDESLAVMMDPTQISQIIVNLSTNAAHAMNETGGILELFMERVELEQEAAAVFGDLKPGPYVNLIIRDTGCGMKRDVLDRIFEPFFTTKEVGEGSGMGLAVVHGIIKSCGGAIAVDSQPGEGSTFSIYLPAFANRKDTEREKDRPVIKGKGHILFVDNEEQVLETSQGILEYLGYSVTVKTSSVDALEVFRAMPQEFDLVITDMTLPHMTGDKLALEMIRVKPDIPIIMYTGYGYTTTPSKAKSMGIRQFLTKPVTAGELSEIIYRVMNPAIA